MSDDGLQFDRAEYEQPPSSLSCCRCLQPLSQTYYQVNGQLVCPPCGDALRADWTGGSRAGRVVRASAAGFGAAVLGALLYYAISAMTGYEFGLIAIVVGFGVGTAVRWGSKGRGGWAYQALAIGLTYLAIVSTYVPPIIAAAVRQAEQQASTAATASAASPGTPAVAGLTSTTNEPPPSLARALVGITLLLLLLCAAPFLAGFQNIIGIVIIGIGLYEAWKLNRRVPFDITGPHTVASMAASV